MINKGKSDRSYNPIKTYQIKYFSGICSTCLNDYSDLEMHYQKNPEHKKIK
jgi:hypothetical protein